MKQIMLHGANDWRLDDIPDASPAPRDVLVRIAACGICGTDVSYVHMGLIPGHPIPLGHEMAGVVEWVGGEVRDVTVGDRVIVCPSDLGSGTIGTGGGQGGLTPLLHVPEVATGRRLFPVPDGMPLTTAALAEPLAVGMQSVNQADVVRGRRWRSSDADRSGSWPSRRWPTVGSPTRWPSTSAVLVAISRWRWGRPTRSTRPPSTCGPS